MRYLTPLLLLFALIVTKPLTAASDEYPDSDLLVEPSELVEGDGSARVILDARSKEAFEEARIPGAQHVDVGEWKSAFAAGEDAEQWSERIAKLGIERDSQVVVYDDNSSLDAARIWWTLRYWGVDDARLLNGGWKGWQAIDGPTETGEAKTPERSQFAAEAVPQRLATKESVLQQLKIGSLQMVDSRSESEYCGLDQRANQRSGSIPGAKHLEWSDLIDAETERFKSPEELRKLYESRGVDLDRPVATHCQSGGRASVMAFGLELMGADQVQNYYAGWSEWGKDRETPVVKPQPQDREESEEEKD